MEDLPARRIAPWILLGGVVLLVAAFMVLPGVFVLTWELDPFAALIALGFCGMIAVGTLISVVMTARRRRWVLTAIATAALTLCLVVGVQPFLLDDRQVFNTRRSAYDSAAREIRHGDADFGSAGTGARRLPWWQCRLSVDCKVRAYGRIGGRVVLGFRRHSFLNDNTIVQVPPGRTIEEWRTRRGDHTSIMEDLGGGWWLVSIDWF